jgi:hypothetical protein
MSIGSKAATYCHLLPKFSASGSISPLCSCLQDTRKDNLTFTFTISTTEVKLWQYLHATKSFGNTNGTCCICGTHWSFANVPFYYAMSQAYIRDWQLFCSV